MWMVEERQEMVKAMCYKKYRVTKQVFSEKEEQLFVDYVIRGSRMFHGLSISATRKFALDYAKRDSKQCPESWDTNCLVLWSDEKTPKTECNNARNYKFGKSMCIVHSIAIM